MEILTAVSEGRKLVNLNIGRNNLSELDPGLLTMAVTQLETFDVYCNQLTQQQKVAILSAVSEGSQLVNLYIGGNNLSEVDPGLLAKAVTKLETLKVRNCGYGNLNGCQ